MRARSGRLKNFCQYCRKQCKDQNGFHCHLNSSSHQRKVREYVTNPNEHIEKYSKQLEWKFVQMLKVKYPGESKSANDLWEQYSQEKYHIEFKRTQWKNLQEFVQHLKTVKNLAVSGDFPTCKVTYLINRTSEFVKQQKQRQMQSIREREKQHEQNSLKNKMERVRELEETKFQKVQQELKKKHEQIEQHDINNRLFMRIEGFGQDPKRNPQYDTEQLQDQVNEEMQQQKSHKKVKNTQILLEKLKRQKGNEKLEKQQQEDDPEWVIEGIYVKIKAHEISQAFHGKKCKVVRVVEPYVAQVQAGNATLQIDQSNLETVIPKVNHKVKLLLGNHRGKQGILERVYIEEGFGVVNVDQKLYQVLFSAFSKVD